MVVGRDGGEGGGDDGDDGENGWCEAAAELHHVQEIAVRGGSG